MLGIGLCSPQDIDTTEENGMPRGKTTYQLNVRLDTREKQALDELNEHYKNRYEQSDIIRILILREARRIKKQKKD